MLDIEIPDPLTSPSLISLNSFWGYKAPCFLPSFLYVESGNVGSRSYCSSAPATFTATKCTLGTANTDLRQFYFSLFYTQLNDRNNFAAPKLHPSVCSQKYLRLQWLKHIVPQLNGLLFLSRQNGKRTESTEPFFLLRVVSLQTAAMAETGNCGIGLLLSRIYADIRHGARVELESARYCTEPS